MTGTGTLRLSYFTAWLASGERGISSNAIVNQLTGQPVGRRSFPGDDHPHDPADFRRCEQLLDQHPLARLALPELATRSPEWAALVEHWEELRALLRAERTERSDGTAPATYARMQVLLAGARA